MSCHTLHILFAVALVVFVSPISAQSPFSRRSPRFRPINPGSPAFRRRRNTECNIPFRTHDGTCSNPTDPTWASTNRPTFSYFPNHDSRVMLGKDLNSTRLISNAVSTQEEDDIPNERNLNDFLTSFGQFLDHDYALAPLGEEKAPIEIPEDDELFREENGEFEFTRSTRGIIDGAGGAERAINSLTSVIDLSNVYGSDDERNRDLRTLVDGRLKTSANNLLPFNTMGITNAPSTSSSFFVAGDIRVAEHPVLTALHVLFVREHNRICAEVKSAFPRDDDDEIIYQRARMINIAQYQRIVYEEFLPAMMGRPLRPYTGFSPSTDPTVSNLFTTAAYRIGHTLVAGTVSRQGPRNVNLPAFQMSEIFFRPSTSFTDTLCDEVLRGAINTRAQEVDAKVVDTLRNFLFKTVEEEEGIDLIAINLQRSRDHALASYNDIRERFGVPRARTFADVTSDRETQERLAYAYATPDEIEAWIGLMAEDRLPGASIGRTMFAVWTAEFTRLRDGDQFFFLNIRRRLNRLRRVGTVGDLFRSRGLMRDIILRNTGLSPSEIPDPFNAFTAS